LTLSTVIDQCHYAGQKLDDGYEILIADNGSNDNSIQIGTSKGARIINVERQGYGSALQGGIKDAKGKFIIMGDADNTYNFLDSIKFFRELEKGYELVMGNRFKGDIEKGAMPILHRYLGNPVLSKLGQLFFGLSISDFHCGLRAFKKSAILALGLNCDGMEFASEMIIKSALCGLKIKELPTSLRRSHQHRKAHLRTWRDGWRHLKFMLSYSPTYAYLVFSIIFFIFFLIGSIGFSLKINPLSGSNTLVISSFMYFSSLMLFSEYINSKFTLLTFYEDTLKRFSSYRNDLKLKKIQNSNFIDLLYRLSLFLFVTSSILLLRSFNSIIIEGYLGNDLTISTFMGSLLFSTSLTFYLIASRTSTLKSLLKRY